MWIQACQRSVNGRVMPLSGGDWALFRPDDVLATDERYMLEADDGTKILMYNRGYLWGRQPDTLERMREWMFRDGKQVPFEEFYLRSAPTFETEAGPHDWLMKYIFIGIGHVTAKATPSAITRCSRQQRRARRVAAASMQCRGCRLPLPGSAPSTRRARTFPGR
jgi:hypothetical protein